MRPVQPPVNPSRRRWILLYPLISMAMYFVLQPKVFPWVELGILLALGAVMALCEFVLMPRMSFPPSRWCTRCDSRSRADKLACVGCGGEFSTFAPVLYAVDLTRLPASKKPRRIAFVIVGVLIVPVIALGIFNPRPAGQGIGLTMYFLVAIYGYEFAKWFALRRLVRQIREHSGAVCTTCVYPLDESMIRCPECSMIGRASDARRDWLTTGFWLPDKVIKPGEPASALQASP
ncbi:MAG: hypothetical protein ACREJD_12995 [Phycisphaerales bacterium]